MPDTVEVTLWEMTRHNGKRVLVAVVHAPKPEAWAVEYDEPGVDARRLPGSGADAQNDAVEYTGRLEQATGATLTLAPVWAEVDVRALDDKRWLAAELRNWRNSIEKGYREPRIPSTTPFT